MGEFGAVSARFVHPRGVGVARRGRGLKAAASEKGRARVSTLKPIRLTVARLGAVIILAAQLKKMAFRRKKIQKTPPEELRRARARLYTVGRAFFACHERARARTLRALWQPAQKKPHRKPPQNLRRRRSLCRLPSASAAHHAATATRQVIAAAAHHAATATRQGTKTRLVIAEVDHARAARARRRTA